MRVGIPDALFIKEKLVMYKYFFEELGIEVVTSTPTTRKTIESGNLFATSEDCIASKIFLGHVYELVNTKNLDYIILPRIFKYKNNREACVKAFAMYDICKNLFDFDFIDINIDYSIKSSFLRALTRTGINLGFSMSKSFLSAINAIRAQKKYDEERYLKQFDNIDFNKKNVLIIGTEYLVKDRYINKILISNLETSDMVPIYACISREDYEYKNISKQVYFENSIKILKGIEEYLPVIDACILITGFSCATDSLVHEMIKEKLKDITYIEIVIDENTSDTGIITRLESFKDILDGSSYIC